MIVFFDYLGIIFKEFMPPESTVIAEFYKYVLKKILKVLKIIARVRPTLWKDWSSFLLYDNAPAHTATIVTQFLTNKIVSVLDHHRIHQIKVLQIISCFQS